MRDRYICYDIACQCPPVAVAVAQARKQGVSLSRANQLDFKVTEVADSMGWESGPVKRELKLLQWQFGGCLFYCIYT